MTSIYLGADEGDVIRANHEHRVELPNCKPALIHANYWVDMTTGAHCTLGLDFQNGHRSAPVASEKATAIVAKYLAKLAD